MHHPCQTPSRAGSTARPHSQWAHADVAEAGNAIVLGLFFLVLAMGVIVSGTVTTEAMRTASDLQFRANAQATQLARSGLTEALSWYRRQAVQPVDRFEPRLDPVANPPLQDTMDPVIGLVREARVGGTISGRYEVWREWLGDPDPERAGLRRQLAARDISLSRLGAPGGAAWRLRSVGFVFSERDPTRAFDETPNQVLASAIAEAEILRLRLQPPGTSAISTRDAQRITIGSNARVEGGAGAAGIFALEGSGAPTVSGTLTGTPSLLQDPAYSCTPELIFGVTLRDLYATADLVVETGVQAPAPLPENSLVVIEGDAVFDVSRPLRGTAVVLVDGNLTIAPGSASSFHGLLYVNGNLDVAAPADFTGAIVVADGKSILVRGIGDWVTIHYDAEVLESLRREIGQYRIAGAIRVLDRGEF